MQPGDSASAPEKVQLPDRARAGIEILRLVVESLLTTSRYVDEEGEATLALAELSACICDPPFKLKDDIAPREAARRIALSDVDPVVLEVWKLQGRTVGAMLRESAQAVEELQEEVAELKDAARGPRPLDAEVVGILRIYQSSLGNSREQCDDGGKRMWDRIEAAIGGANAAGLEDAHRNAADTPTGEQPEHG